MHDLANDSKLANGWTSDCYNYLNKYLELTDSFTELARLVSLVNSTRHTRLVGELHSISVAVGDFLSRLHNFLVSQKLKVLWPVHTQRKRKRNRKYYLMFVSYSCIFSFCSLIFFAFVSTCVCCECSSLIGPNKALPKLEVTSNTCHTGCVYFKYKQFCDTGWVRLIQTWLILSST